VSKVGAWKIERLLPQRDEEKRKHRRSGKANATNMDNYLTITMSDRKQLDPKYHQLSWYEL